MLLATNWCCELLAGMDNRTPHNLWCYIFGLFHHIPPFSIPLEPIWIGIKLHLYNLFSGSYVFIFISKFSPVSIEIRFCHLRLCRKIYPYYNIIFFILQV
jgi:hypothetical protein